MFKMRPTLSEYLCARLYVKTHNNLRCKYSFCEEICPKILLRITASSLPQYAIVHIINIEKVNRLLILHIVTNGARPSSYV